MDALEAMTNLIRNMPHKSERMDIIKSALVKRAQASRPSFRSLLDTVENWELSGYNDDPNKIKLPNYRKLTFEDIVRWHQQEIKDKPLLITIVGDKKRFDLKAPEKYGEITVKKEKDRFVN